MPRSSASQLKRRAIRQTRATGTDGRAERLRRREGAQLFVNKGKRTCFYGIERKTRYWMSSMKDRGGNFSLLREEAKRADLSNQIRWGGNYLSFGTYSYGILWHVYCCRWCSPRPRNHIPGSSLAPRSLTPQASKHDSIADTTRCLGFEK